MFLAAVPAIIAPVPTIIAPILAPIPTASHPPDRDGGRTGDRSGPHDRSPSHQSSTCTSTSTQHLRLLPSLLAHPPRPRPRWPGSESGRSPPTARLTGGRRRR